jgi:hypothetical protein
MKLNDVQRYTVTTKFRDEGKVVYEDVTRMIYDFLPCIHYILIYEKIFATSHVQCERSGKSLFSGIVKSVVRILVL